MRRQGAVIEICRRGGLWRRENPASNVAGWLRKPLRPWCRTLVGETCRPIRDGTPAPSSQSGGASISWASVTGLTIVSMQAESGRDLTSSSRARGWPSLSTVASGMAARTTGRGRRPTRSTGRRSSGETLSATSCRRTRCGKSAGQCYGSGSTLTPIRRFSRSRRRWTQPSPEVGEGLEGRHLQSDRFVGADKHRCWLSVGGLVLGRWIESDSRRHLRASRPRLSVVHVTMSPTFAGRE